MRSKQGGGVAHALLRAPAALVSAYSGAIL